MKAYIIDDSFIDILVLKLMLSKYCPEIKLVGDTDNYRTAVLEVQNMEIDVLFINMDMGDGKLGFHIMDELSDFGGAVIFVAADGRYALDAFQYNAIHYLVKPIVPNSLKTALLKVKKTHRQELMASAPKPDKQSGVISLWNNKSVDIVKVAEILYVQAEGSYSRVFIHNAANIRTAHNLKSISQKLMYFHQFIRVHKSYLINKDFIVGFKRPKTLEMKDTSYIPISNSYKSVIRKIL